jgi:hypothetical protein
VRTDVVPEWVGPVCSPQDLRQKRIESVGDLARARLMASRTRPSAWDDWALCSSQANSSCGSTNFVKLSAEFRWLQGKTMVAIGQKVLNPSHWGALRERRRELIHVWGFSGCRERP